ncbi:MAG: methyltransferase domain-containing protein [Peptostreptococcaceae bacterium]
MNGFYKEGTTLGTHSEVDFKQIPIVDSRVRFIPEYCKGKVVLTIGCVDMINASPIEEIIKNGNHQMYNLRNTCSKVVGIDINKEGIEILNKMGFEAYCYDIQSESLEELERQTYDVLVISHIIEHIPNMYKFVETIIQKFRFKEIIVAVPNSYHFYNIINMCIKNKEVVSNDHYYTFTPITLMKLMNSLDLECKALYFDREITPRFIPENVFLKNIYLLLYKKIINKNGNLIYIGNTKMEANKVDL